MKLAYRIVTPILSVGAIALGIFLKMFYFAIGNADEQIGTLINAVAQLSQGKISTTYEYSVFELIKMVATAKPAEDGKSFTEICSAIMPHLIAFFVVIALVACVFIAIAVISAAMKNEKKQRKTVICLSVAGLVLLFVCILITNAAFTKIINGEISLADLLTLVSGNALMALATVVVSVTQATLSAGFYAMFGIFMFIIMFTILANFVEKSPIQVKKTYKRKKPMRRLSAIGAKK